MQSRAARLGLLGVVIVAAVVLFIVLQNDNSDDSSDTAKGVQVLQSRPERRSGRRREDADLQQGRSGPVRGTAGCPQEEVHVHGYEKETPAEHSPVSLSFPATLDGVFEVEVHQLDNTEGPIAELHVNP